MISANKQRIIYIASDVITTALAWFLFNIIRFNNIVVDAESYNSLSAFLTQKNVLLGQIFFPILMFGIYALSGYYNHVFLKSRVEEFVNTLTTAFIGTITIYFIAIFNDPIPDRASNYELVALLMTALFIIVYLARLTITTNTNKRAANGQLRFNALILGTGRAAIHLRKKLENNINIHSHAYRIMGYVQPEGKSDMTAADLPVFSITQLPQQCKELNISAIIATSHHNGMHATLDTFNRLLPLDIPILISPTLYELIASKSKISRLVGEPLIDITRPNMSDSTVNLKRCGDIIVSAIALIALLPIYAIIAIAIKCDSRGKIIYSQERVGMHKKRFKIYKFRTMHADAESNGPALSSENDSRITPLGHWLRKYRLDELPQFWNVLKGDMSLVGPRPERMFYISQIMERAPYYILLHQVRPGITSLGMVKHGYASNVDQMIERLQYDLVYLENISLITDLKIAIYTISTVLHGRGM
jgi:exopolysaccharide biosynthesis polyprenyl glycosylphosphotransferase